MSSSVTVGLRDLLSRHVTILSIAGRVRGSDARSQAFRAAATRAPRPQAPLGVLLVGVRPRRRARRGISTWYALGRGTATPWTRPKPRSPLHLDELADLAEASHRPLKAAQVGQGGAAAGAPDRHADLAREKVTIVDDELPVTMQDLLALLREKAPTAGPTTRRQGATHRDRRGRRRLQRAVDGPGRPRRRDRVAVTGVEGDEDPAANYWRPYTAQHIPDQARELAGKLRACAASGR